jgi:hypothetical protein
VSTAAAVRGISVEELQAAMTAARDGAFAAGSGAASTRRLVPADVCDWRPSGPVVAVLAAHAGAGASTVAVALADALASTGAATRLLDLADPARSCLAAATNAELGVDDSGWHRGRRSRVIIDRLAHTVATAHDIPGPRVSQDEREWLVLDLGCPIGELHAASGWLARCLDNAAVLLVCRPTVPGMRRAEHALDLLADQSLRAVAIAAVGAAKWPSAALATCGPRLRAARADGRLISVPFDRHIAVEGVTPDPLSKPLAAAGRRLATLLRQPQLTDAATSAATG